MIEVLFGESEAGAMKYAKSNQEIRDVSNEAVSVWGDASVLPSAGKWKSVQGTPDEVICCPYMLDVGDIRQTCDSAYRQNLMFSMYTQSGWDNSKEYLDDIKEGIKQTAGAYNRLLEFLESGAEIRIWYSYAPYSICGLYWLSHVIGDRKNKIYTVELPKYEERENNTIITYKNWGEVAAEQYSSFLPLQKELTALEKSRYRQNWIALAEDNSPLRVVINGEVVGVPEDFYDFLIRKNITKKPVKEARLIGDLLGKYRISCSDWWYAKRIEQMIKNGEVSVLEDCEHKYARTICLI